MPVLELTDASFDAEVLRASEPVLIDVWAAWCAPCKALDPVMQRLAEQFDGQARIAKLDADANLETVTRFDVRALPTLLLFDRGTLVERFSGAQALGTLATRLQAQLALRATGELPTAARVAAPRPVSSGALGEAEQLVNAADPMVVFKHSVTCSISIHVKQQYDAFVAANPDVATRVVVVQTERPLSNALEQVTHVRHESPQALVVRGGKVLWHASHRRITAAALEQAVQMAQGATTAL
jgi:thioredoxin 1